MSKRNSKYCSKIKDQTIKTEDIDYDIIRNEGSNIDLTQYNSKINTNLLKKVDKVTSIRNNQNKDNHDNMKTENNI